MVKKLIEKTVSTPVKKPVDLYYKIMRFIIILICIYFSVLVGYFSYFVLEVSRINQDAGTYLSLAERISEGVTLYFDIASEYAPLTFYIFAFSNYLFGGNGSYEFYIGISLLIQVLSSLIRLPWPTMSVGTGAVIPMV